MVESKKITNFQKKVYSITKRIPKGKVTTYKRIADRLGNKSYRAVGTALNRNPFFFSKKGDVPWHRVIRSDGKIGGFASGTSNKNKLLKSEGVSIKNNKINLKKHSFNQY